MNRKPLTLTLSLVLAVIGALLLFGYVRTAGASSSSGDLVPVLVATKTIETGTPAKGVADLVTSQEVPKASVSEGAVRDLDDLAGKVANRDILPGEQLSLTRFVTPENLKQANVPDNHFEVTVELDPVRALGGKIEVGQTVAVLVSADEAGDGDGDGDDDPATGLLLSKVVVTRVSTTEALPDQDATSAWDLAPTSTLLITLAVDAPSLTKLVYAAEHSRIWLASDNNGASPDGAGGVVRQATVLP